MNDFLSRVSALLFGVPWRTDRTLSVEYRLSLRYRAGTDIRGIQWKILSSSDSLKQTTTEVHRWRRAVDSKPAGLVDCADQMRTRPDRGSALFPFAVFDRSFERRDSDPKYDCGAEAQRTCCNQ